MADKDRPQRSSATAKDKRPTTAELTLLSLSAEVFKNWLLRNQLNDFHDKHCNVRCSHI